MQELIEHLYTAYCRCPLISTDSRQISSGCLFFGLKGDHVDGSRFGASAIAQGASVAIVRYDSCDAVEGVVFVKDPLEVLQKLAEYHRTRLDIPIFGITGSNGKTTTKELLSRVLSSKYQVLATRGNLNNHIGMPLTLLSIQPSHQFAIIEMGANHIGEIRLLCSIARPTHGVVTNIGKAHLEGFGGIEGVQKAKAELYESLVSEAGVVFVNRDEPFLSALSEKVSRRVFYGFNQKPEHRENNYWFSVQPTSTGWAVHFKDAQGREWNADSTLFGDFNLANIATAIAVGVYFEIEGSNICNAIASYVPDNNRAQRLTQGSNIFIMDAYNANPTSMRSAIQSFAALDHPNKYMILGAMMELGAYTPDEHLAIARLAAEQHDTTTILVGDQFREAAKTYAKQWYANVDDMKRSLSADLPHNALILVKGSRAMRLEGLLSAFQ